MGVCLLILFATSFAFSTSDPCASVSCPCGQTCSNGTCQGTKKTCTSPKVLNSLCECVDPVCPRSCGSCGCSSGTATCKKDTTTCAAGKTWSHSLCSCVCTRKCTGGNQLDTNSCTCVASTVPCPTSCANGCYANSAVCIPSHCTPACTGCKSCINGTCETHCNAQQVCDQADNRCKLKVGGTALPPGLTAPNPSTTPLPSVTSANPALGKVIALPNSAINIQGEQTVRSIYSIGRTDRPDYLCWQKASNTQYKLRLDYFCPSSKECPYGMKCPCRNASNQTVKNTLCQYATLDPLRTESFGLHSETDTTIPNWHKQAIINNNHTVPITTH